MSEIRRVIESSVTHGRVKATEDGVIIEIKLWNATTKSGSSLHFPDLFRLREVMADWQLLIEEAERLTSVYGKK